MATPQPSSSSEHHQQLDGAAPEASQKSSASLGAADNKPGDDAPAVRFASAVEEIGHDAQDLPSVEREDSADTFTEATADELKAFTKQMQGQPLQERRMNTFQFEPFSLPASRVPSREDDSADSSRLATPTTPGFQSPHGSPKLAAMGSLPLTPAGSDPSGTSDKSGKDAREGAPAPPDAQTITPQPSTSQEKLTVPPERKPLTHRPASSDQIIRRSSSAEERLREHGHRRSAFGIGPVSVPASRESSPSRSAAASNFYSKPMTPGGDANDPYSKGRRPAQQPHTNRHSIDPRFVFSRKKKHSPSESKSSLSDKRSSAVFGKGSDLSPSSTAATGNLNGSQGSMSDLKRFFRGGHHHHQHKKRDSSPASIKPGTKTPPSSRSTTQLPFGDDHGLSTKYGKLGRVLGSGAGGSVRLMKRREDSTIFAVKEFRARHTYETVREYNKKVTAEFCVGSTLHHGNIIETLDILQEKGRWYEVMEYAPFDLFAIVMTGRMTREEITCCFLQVLNGVTYLHSVGLAHRDLKLDNVVVSDKGIMKIIDFGSAHVFKYPFENDTNPAKGIVGSDPYLAPEVYDGGQYDAAAVDIWSLAIIFCCMTLRRFPWKVPRMTDNSFKLFAAEPTPGHDPKKLVGPSKSTSDLNSTVPRDFLPEGGGKEEKSQHPHHHHHHHHKSEDTDSAPSTQASSTANSAQGGGGEKKEVIRGPWRILRLLPRESRHIIHRMLDLNPKTRAGMEEILQEPWVADTVICQQVQNGEVIPAGDHTHILEPPASQQVQKA